MKISIEKGKDLIELPEIRADAELGKHIPHPLPNRSGFCMLICGGPGTGKTSTTVSLLTSKKRRAYYKTFSKVHLVIPPNSLKSIKNPLIEKHKRVYDELSLDSISEIMGECKQSSMEDEHSLVVFDDVQAALKNKYIQPILHSLIMNRRHLKTSIIILQQSLNALPLNYRKACSHVLMFPMTNKKSFEQYFSEILNMDKDTAARLVRTVFQNPHDNLFIDLYSTPARYYRNWGEIHIEEDE